MADGENNNNEILEAIKDGFNKLTENMNKKIEVEPPKQQDESISTIIKNEFTALKEYLKPKEENNNDPKEEDVKVPKIPEPEPDVEDDPVIPQESSITKFLKRVLIG